MAQNGEYGLIVGWLFWIIASITLHELAHGWAALWQGDPTPRALGHMTASPMVHMGPMSLIALALVGIAWGAMPVNPQNFRMGRVGDALVALAGPAMNFALAFVTALLTPLAYHFSEEMGGLLELGVGLNILLGLFNLMPIPPFDGGRILVALVREVRQLFDSPGGQNIFLIAFMNSLSNDICPNHSFFNGFASNIALTCSQDILTHRNCDSHIYKTIAAYLTLVFVI